MEKEKNPNEMKKNIKNTKGRKAADDVIETWEEIFVSLCMMVSKEGIFSTCALQYFANSRIQRVLQISCEKYRQASPSLWRLLENQLQITNE